MRLLHLMPKSRYEKTNFIMAPLSFRQKYASAITQVSLMVACMTYLYWGQFFYITESTQSAWWATLLRCFSLVTLPTTILIFLGMMCPPLPVEPDKITNSSTRIVIRWTTRGIYPHLVNEVVKKTMEHLRDHLDHIRLEIVTEQHILDTPGNVDFQEIVIPSDYVPPNKSLFKARALHYGVQFSECGPDDYILHLDEESVVTENLYLGVRQFISTNFGYIGQGIITYADANHSFQSFLCHWADALRTGDDFARFRFQCVIHRNLVGMKGSFMVIPNSIEREVGFDHGPESSITEDAYFAMLNWDKIRFCRGILEEQSPFTLWDTVKQRRRWASGLWKLLWYHPAAWWKKSFLTLQMIAWTLSPLVGVSLVASFVLYNYSMPPFLSGLLTFNFLMFNFQYMWGCYHLMHTSWQKKWLCVIFTPLALPLFFCLEGFAGVYGTICPVQSFLLVKKESQQMLQELSSIQVAP